MKLSKIFDSEIYYYTEVFNDPKWIIDSLNKMDSDTNTHNAITPWYTWLSSNNSNHSFGEKKIFTITIKI